MSGADRVVGLVREPTARFRSAFLHSRRAGEDPDTFTPVMQAMRRDPLAAFLRTPDGQMELRQQLLMLGFDYASDYGMHRDAELVAVAKSLLDDERCLFRPTEHIEEFVSEVAGMLRIDFSGARLGRVNAASLEEADRSTAEFEQALPEIEAGNNGERELYDLVVSRSWRLVRAVQERISGACLGAAAEGLAP